MEDRVTLWWRERAWTLGAGPGGRVRLGRVWSAELELPAHVSAEHGWIKRDGGRWTYTDNHSSNGTLFAGADDGPMTWRTAYARIPVEIRVGTELRLGGARDPAHVRIHALVQGLAYSGPPGTRCEKRMTLDMEDCSLTVSYGYRSQRSQRLGEVSANLLRAMLGDGQGRWPVHDDKSMAVSKEAADASRTRLRQTWASLTEPIDELKGTPLFGSVPGRGVRLKLDHTWSVRLKLPCGITRSW